MAAEGEENFGNKKEGKGYSRSEEHSILYTWEIEKISLFIKSARESDVVSELITSPEFSTSAKLQDSWQLFLTIKNGNKDDPSNTKSWVSFFLQPKNNLRIRTKYSLFLLNNKQKKIGYNCKNYNESYVEWLEWRFKGSGMGYGYSKFIKIDDLLNKENDLIQDDTLTVGVDLIVYDDHVAKSGPIKSLTSLKRKLNDDIQDLFNSKRKCDILISVGEEKFDAHKLILSARSTVFEAMFSHDMLENKESKITIPDIDSKIFKKVLEYIYTDEIEDLNSDAEQLLEAADKYHLETLKEICEDHLSENLSLENATSILILADRHNANQLKEVAINYVVTNLPKFRSDEEFKALESSYPALFLAALKRYADFDTK